MQYTSAILLSAASLIASVSAHGSLSSPPPRLPGPAMAAACGKQVEGNQAADRHGNIQGMLQVASNQPDYDAVKCRIWQCKGYKFEDNTDKVQSWTAGQVVPMTFNVAAPHTGTANVSIVDTASDRVIKQLAYWPDFASTATGVKVNETAFSVTIPDDLGSQCATAGACVLQHWWDAPSIKQTYESCIDFTVGGSGGSAGGSGGSAGGSGGSGGSAGGSGGSGGSTPASPPVVATGAAAPAVTASSSSINNVAANAAPMTSAPTTLATVVKPTGIAPAAADKTPAPAEDETCDASD